ncbi:MAG: nitroreductase family protein [Actinobacteria bacterium]|jgi:nitroreductase|nr:nitroreductase family protein [Actinomycetota bacterium]
MKSFTTLMELIETRRSIRSYKDQEIEEDKLNYVLQAFRKAPSAKNLQPWKLVVVKNKKVIKDLAIACNNQTFLEEAPVIIAACAKEEEAYGMMGGYMNSYPIDIAIALEHLILAATEKGLGTCWIGAFKEQLVKDILGVPKDVKVVALTPLGYPAREASIRGRKPLTEIISYDKYF